MKLNGQQLIQQLQARDLIAQISGDQELEAHLENSDQSTVALIPRLIVCIWGTWSSISIKAITAGWP